jgi:uncharacterized membrane protein
LFKVISQENIKKIMAKYDAEAKKINSERQDWQKEQTVIFTLAIIFLMFSCEYPEGSSIIFTSILLKNWMTGPLICVPRLCIRNCLNFSVFFRGLFR